MGLQGAFGGQGAEPQIQSASQGSFNQKTKENTAANAGVKGNKVEVNVSQRSDDEEARKEFDKLLRRPRSRKYMKAIKMLDSLSEGDEMIIAEMKKEAGISADDDLTFTPEDIEAFKQRIQGIIEEEIRKEEERRKEEIRKEEERRKEAERKRRIEEDKLRDTLAPCYISGCQVHSITPSGNIIEHYTSSALGNKSGAYQFARDLIMKHGGTKNFSSVEIYKHRLVHRNSGGDVIKIYQMDDEGNIN